MKIIVNLLSKALGLVIVLALFHSVMKFNSASTYKLLSKPNSYVSADTVDQHLGCLAMNIYREAGNEPFEGKVAVAQVTMNRVDAPSFPKDVCSVVYQKNVILEKTICQFSWFCMTTPKVPTNDPSYKESYTVAKKVLLEGFRIDSLNDALFYHAVYINPNWPYEKITTIGNHIFYKKRNV